MSQETEFPKILRQETMPNGQRKELSEHEPGLWRVEVFSVDDSESEWHETTDKEDARQVFELTTDMDDVNKW